MTRRSLSETSLRRLLLLPADAVLRPTRLIIPERNVPMLLKAVSSFKAASKSRKAEKPKKVHLIKVQFNQPVTADLARSAVRRAIYAAQAKQLSDKATWEASSLLTSDPTVLPIPKAPRQPKTVPPKKARRSKRRKVGRR